MQRGRQPRQRRSCGCHCTAQKSCWTGEVLQGSGSSVKASMQGLGRLACLLACDVQSQVWGSGGDQGVPLSKTGCQESFTNIVGCEHSQIGVHSLSGLPAIMSQMRLRLKMYRKFNGTRLASNTLVGDLSCALCSNTLHTQMLSTPVHCTHPSDMPVHKTHHLSALLGLPGDVTYQASKRTPLYCCKHQTTVGEARKHVNGGSENV